MVATRSSNEDNPILLVRADASPQMGTGHVMRCLALAQAWQDAGGAVIFLTRLESPALVARLRSEGIEVVPLSAGPGVADDSARTVKLAQERNASWVVVDGYQFGEDYQKAIKDANLRLLFLDDFGHARCYWADIVLDQNLGSQENYYAARQPETRLLVGTRYVMLRREFLRWKGWKREFPAVARKVLVTLGGGDSENVTLKVVEALRQVHTEIESTVVVGGESPHFEELQQAVKESGACIRLMHNAEDMPQLMAWADVTVAAAGSTSWELAFLGVPRLALILADHQRLVAEGLAQAGAAENLGCGNSIRPNGLAEALERLLSDASTRSNMAARARELVDGEGTERVLMHLQGMALRLRPVEEKDCRMLWEWANDADVRASSFSKELILWEEHLRWFARKLADPDCFMFIGLDAHDNPVGQVRFDLDKDREAEVDISVASSQRGRGYGALLLRAATSKLFRACSARAIHALIKPNNYVSIAAFERAHFKNLGSANARGDSAWHYFMDRGRGQ